MNGQNPLFRHGKYDGHTKERTSTGVFNKTKPVSDYGSLRTDQPCVTAQPDSGPEN